MKHLPLLYKIDSKGKTRTIHIEFNDYYYISHAGIRGSTLTKNITYPKPKGKNTLAEQVEKEARAKWKNKHERKLYSEDLSKPHPLMFTQPMPALDYTKVTHRANWDEQWVTQPKLNGVRSTVKLNNGFVTVTSREGKDYNVTNIKGYFNSVYAHDKVPESIEFDGELYLHGVQLGDVTHAIAHDDPNLEFRLFDHVDESATFENRYAFLEDIGFLLQDTAIQLVPCTKVLSENELKIIHNKYVAQNYEGAMLRNINAQYTIGQRTPGMFKYKHFQDAEFDIVGFEKDKDGGITLVLITPEGKPFKSRPLGTLANRQQLYAIAPTLIGKPATVRFSELLKTGIPEFNRVLHIRDYE